MTVKISFGQWLKQRRKALDLTREDLAVRIGCAINTLYKIEADERRPSKQIAELFAHHLNIPPDEHLAFIQFARARESDSEAPWGTHFHPPTNLPSQPTLLIGRDEDVSTIHKRLLRNESRLLTLVGPPGIGKTRLALQVAAQALDDFADGVFFVDLAPISDANLVAATIASTLGVPDIGPQTPLERLKAYLRDKQMFLVLDNFEQILAAAAQIAELLAACLWLKILVTSRAPLRIRQERQIPVSALTLPNLAFLPDVESMSHYSAITLFMERAQAVKSDFSLNQENASTVAAICTRLDGLPLAIELISARVKLLPPAALLERLSGWLMLQSDGPHDIEPRHRTLNAAIDWSYQLLSEDEQSLFRRLGIFVGGWTLEAAGAVCLENLNLNILDGLASLLDKNLMKQITRPEGEPRFMMLETIREYALEQFAAGESESIHQVHADYFGDFMERREQDIKFQRQNEALSEIENDFANIRSAWQWAMMNRRHRIIYRMAEALNFFCDMKVRYVDGEEMFRTASDCLASSGDPQCRLTYNRLRARRTRMIILGGQGHLFDAEKLRIELETVVAENRIDDDPAETAFSLSMYGEVLHLMVGNRTPAIPYLEESFHIYKELNDSFYVAESLVLMSFIRQPGEEFLKQAIDLQRQIGDENGLCWTLMTFVDRAFLNLHHSTEVERYAQEALAIQRRRGDVKGMWTSLMNSGERYLSTGEFEKALVVAEESYQHALTMNITGFKKAAQARLGLINILMEKNYQKGKELCVECLSVSLPNLPRLIGPAPDLDAAFALAIMAYTENDSSAMRSYYQQIIHNLSDWGPTGLFQFLAPIALLIFDHEAKTEQAVEVAARVYGIVPQPFQPVMLWLKKWPLLKRLREKWEYQLGQDAFTVAWERGEKLDVMEMVKVLQNDLFPHKQSRI